MNPLFNALNTTTSANNASSLMQAYKTFLNAGNPMVVFKQMAIKNPQLQPILSVIESGGNPEQIARQMMAQRGINPDEFIKQLNAYK
jgi:hypothetical protein